MNKSTIFQPTQIMSPTIQPTNLNSLQQQPMITTQCTTKRSIVSSSKPPIGSTYTNNAYTNNNNNNSKVIRCRFFVNGDKHFTGIPFVINHDRFRTLDSLCTELSRILINVKTLPSGVRIIFNGNDGLKINSIRQFRPNEYYVCSSSEHFIRFDYLSINQFQPSTPSTNQLSDESISASNNNESILTNHHTDSHSYYSLNQPNSLSAITSASSNPRHSSAFASIRRTVSTKRNNKIRNNNCNKNSLSQNHLNIDPSMTSSAQPFMSNSPMMATKNNQMSHSLSSSTSSASTTNPHYNYFQLKPKLVALLRGSCRAQPSLRPSRRVFRFLISHRITQNYEQLLNEVSKCVKLNIGAVHKIYALSSSKKITCLNDLNDEEYVYLVYGRSEKCSLNDFLLDDYEQREICSIVGTSYLEAFFNKKPFNGEKISTNSLKINKKVRYSDEIDDSDNDNNDNNNNNPNLLPKKYNFYLTDNDRNQRNVSKSPITKSNVQIDETNEYNCNNHNENDNFNHDDDDNRDDSRTNIEIELELSRNHGKFKESDDEDNHKTLSLRCEIGGSSNIKEFSLEVNRFPKSDNNNHYSGSVSSSATVSLTENNNKNEHSSQKMQETRQFETKPNEISNERQQYGKFNGSNTSLVFLNDYNCDDNDKECVSSLSPSSSNQHFSMDNGPDHNNVGIPLTPAMIETSTRNHHINQTPGFESSTPGGASSVSCSEDFSFASIENDSLNDSHPHGNNSLVHKDELSSDDDDNDSCSSIRSYSNILLSGTHSKDDQKASKSKPEEVSVDSNDKSVQEPYLKRRQAKKPQERYNKDQKIDDSKNKKPIQPETTSKKPKNSLKNTPKTPATTVTSPNSKTKITNKDKPKQSSPLVSTGINKFYNLRSNDVKNKKSSSPQQEPKKKRKPTPKPELDEQQQEQQQRPALNQIPAATRFKPKEEVNSLYFVDKSIGDGKFGVVYTCIHRQTRQSYAMKVVDKSTMRQVLRDPNDPTNGKDGKDSNELDEGNSEVSILKMVKHPNIVQLFDHFDYVDQSYLVLELLQGGDLFDAITIATKYTEQESAVMISDLLDALNYLHQLNIVHRDIKLENLLVSYVPIPSNTNDNSMKKSSSGKQYLQTIKLADFGLAIQVKPEQKLYTVCGTPTYVAPEILLEVGYSFPVDVWAAGVILYILLSGIPPFNNEDNDQLILFDKIIAGNFEFHEQHWSEISEDAKQMIKSMLCCDQKKRITAKQVIQHSWLKQFNLKKEL